eukprot:c18582_g1_i1.p1 GENE.c18582_g1_i1~~c18582_g1_i1.p1  ORF type:complete len:733 (-),score=175.89 c18582_g1_i1:73-2271(-)
MTSVDTSKQGWVSTGMSQEDFMAADTCLALDYNDNVIGSVQKKESHVFAPQQPRGILHRAFSVFLFDESGRLLLQQRAASKITFPKVWTNTCCSHPLHGQTPSEVDGHGEFHAIKHAAVRKLFHELGIEPHEVPPPNFKFLTRLHYWAADTLTHGPDSPWGENEIDYVLFIRSGTITEQYLKPRMNLEEVSDVKFVTQAELNDMMANPDLLWSPWFRIIAERFLVHWWKDLDRTINTNDFVDTLNIHRFDPLAHHMGGGGKAGPWLVSKKTTTPLAKDTKNRLGVKKQGAYGKVRVHSENIISQLTRFDEVSAAVRVKFFKPLGSRTALDLSNSDLDFCLEILTKGSRSFAEVILQLPKGLCKEVMVFYLVLRALDTIEDDMEAFENSEVKIQLLNNFYLEGLNDSTYSLHGVGQEAEATLLEQFGRVVRVFQTLSPEMQAVIRDITKQMGEGMAEFVVKDLGQGTRNMEEYNRYCHFVAGLVGIGLSDMFSCSGFELKSIGDQTRLSNSMGLFLQKTNIIRDYLEDFVDGRAFWPQTVWRRFASTNNLGEFAQHPKGASSLHCLNALVTDALEHVPDCLAYLHMIKDPAVFRFCAIPQVMAIATLDKCYNNTNVFTGVTKIRKGLACKLILQTATIADVHAVFHLFSTNIASRVAPDDPSARRTSANCQVIASMTANTRSSTSIVPYVVPVVLVASVLLLSSYSKNAPVTSATTSSASVTSWPVFVSSMFR